MRYVQAHYIKPNESARIPARYVILDTEAIRKRNSKGEVQSWALSVCTFLEWTRQGDIRKSSSRFETPTDMWLAISQFTRKGRRTVLYAHNLNYDLRISQALSILPGLAWTLRDMRIDGRGSWSKWSRDKASLILCDSASIFPVKLQELATMFGMTKLPLPEATDTAAMFARCEQDVNILTTAVIQYVEWLRTGVCGNWRMTGASQAWSHWRHSHYTHKILVHDNEQALAAERLAMHAGRAEAHVWGLQRRGPYTEYDWRNSYPRIAFDCELPVRLCGTVESPSFRATMDLSRRFAVLAEVTVDTATPCCPAKHDGRVLWPTGQFDTTIWDPELRLLAKAGAQVTVHRAYLYRKAPALKDWSEWIMYSLHDRSDTIQPWQKLILKHWSRALIGRFGMRYKTWEKYATAPDSRVCMSPLYDLDNGSMRELMQIGTDIFISGDYREIDDGCPQITSYIMSEARARLWRAIATVGERHVLYVDTDSLIVDPDGHRAIQQQCDNPLFDGLRSKAKFRELRIYGPRAYIADNHNVVAGMPRSSIEVERGKWVGEVWQGAKEAIRANTSDEVRIQIRPFKMEYNQKRRYFNGDGTTLPYRLPGYAPDGKLVLKESKNAYLRRIGYPAMLAPPTSNGYHARPEQGRNTIHNPVRSVPQKVPGNGKGMARAMSSVRQF